MLCDVMMCSRCGSRRQITNTKFFSLTLPISSIFLYFSLHHQKKHPGGDWIQLVERTIILYLKHSIYILIVPFLLIQLFLIVYGNLQLLMKLKVWIVKGCFVGFVSCIDVGYWILYLIHLLYQIIYLHLNGM